MTNAARQGYETTCRIEKLKDGNLRLAFSTKLAHLFNKPPGTTYRVRPGLIDRGVPLCTVHLDSVNKRIDYLQYGVRLTT